MRVQAQLGGQAGQDVLPDRVARRRVEEPDALGVAGRLQAEQELARRGRDHLLRPLGGERRAARELLEREHVHHREVVVAGQADRAVGLGQRHAGVRARPRSRRGRRGTTAPPSRRPGPRRSRPRRRVGCRGCRRRWRPAWPYSLFGAQPVAPADRPRHRARRGRGGRGADAAARPRAGSGARGGPSLLQCGPAGAGRVVPVGAAVARGRADGDRHRRPRALRPPPARAADGPPPPGAGGRGDGRGHLRGRRPRRRCRCARSPASAPRTSGWSRRTGRAGRPTWPAPRPSAAVFAGAGGALLIVGMRRAGRRWWMPGAVVVVAFAVVSVYAGPVVLEPLFNKFTPLPAGELRRDVLQLADEAGVDVGEVYEMDASRRTTAANAYVGGLGPDQARGALRHAGARLHARRDAPRGRARARPRAPPRPAQRAAVDRDRGAVRHVGRGGAVRAPRAARRAARPARRARRRALAGAAPAADHVDLQPALARRRAPRGRLRAGADARPAAPSRASRRGSPARTSPTRTRRRSPASSSAPTRRRSSGSARRRRSLQPATARRASRAAP